MQKEKIDFIFFDCDSTLVSVEGLDEMAKMAGCYHKVKDMTKQSMDGNIPYEEVLKSKFRIISPSIYMVRELGKIYVNKLVPGAREVVQVLGRLGKEVYIATGEIREYVEILAAYLEIPNSRILVNDAEFDENGNFVRMIGGPLMKENGKAEILKQIEMNGKRSAFVGDGFPDCAAREVVDFFVGFGGVAYREKVKQKSDAYVESPSLLPVLDILLTEAELAGLKTYKHGW